MFTAELLKWFDLHRRDLPWRYRQDAYAIWLSEIILQQTRIAQGTAYWERFLRQWPTVEALAAATEDEVLRAWQGLGYYSRARNLHKAAQQVVEWGGFPDNVEGLRRMKGVGDYTAAAIASFSFGRQVAAVDGNVYRVLSRIFGIGTPIDSTTGKKEFAALAQSLVPRERPADFNQALMDFGATQCVPNGLPDCDVCPFVDVCVARRDNRIAALPVKEHRTKIQTCRMVYIYIRCNHQTVLHRRGAGGIWQGLWEPYLVDDATALTQVADSFADCGVLRLLASGVRHVLTHRILLADFYLLDTSKRPVLPDDYVWIDESRLDEFAKPRLIERLLETIPTTC